MVWLVAAGVLVNIYLAALARVLSEAEYGRFVSFVSLVLLISFGGFLPIEQEMARQFQTGRPGRDVFRSAAVVATGIAAVAAVLVIGLVPWLLPPLADTRTLTALLCMCGVGVVQFLVRGTLVGTGRMGTHGMVLLADAVLRLGFAGLVVVGSSAEADAGGYALALIAAIAAAHLPILVWAYRLARRIPGRTGAPASSTGETGRAVAHLVAGSISSQILLNASPILVVAVADAGEADLVGRFAATFTLARVLLFIAVPLQSALVPMFTRVVASGTPEDRRRLAARIGLWALAATAVSTGLAWVAGRQLIEIIFGARYALGPRDIALMVGGAMLYLGLIVAAQALVGAQRHRDVGLAWALALVVAVIVFSAIPDLVLRAELAFALGSAVGLLAAVVRLWQEQGARSTSDSSAAKEGNANGAII